MTISFFDVYIISICLSILMASLRVLTCDQKLIKEIEDIGYIPFWTLTIICCIIPVVNTVFIFALINAIAKGK